MNSTITVQLIRIAMNAIGASIFGDAIASGENYQALVGATVSFVSAAWWAVTEYKNRK